MSYVDLHIHTKYSDGVMTPKDIVEKAKQLQLTDIAFTDHNTFSAVNDVKSISDNINILMGIEFTAYDDYERHILGYFTSDISMEIEAFMTKKRSDFTKVILKCYKQLKSKGYSVSKEDMIDKGRYSATKLCSTIFKKGYTKNENDAYLLVFGLGKKEYKKLWQATTGDCIDLIRNLGGCSILAHPGYYSEKVGENEILSLIDKGVMGVECYHPSHSKEEMDFYTEICKKHFLLITGGSDYHGDNKHPYDLNELKLDKSLCQNFFDYINKK